jgi:hypothetical protein
MLQWLSTYVPSVCSKCFTCFRLCCKRFIWMLHMFYVDDAYVAVAIHVCCKCMFQIFYLFQTMLQVLYLDIAYVAVVRHIYVANVYFSLQWVLLPTCSNSQTSTRCTKRSCTTRCSPPRWSMQPAQHMCMRAMISLCVWYAAKVSLALGHVRCALPLA